MPKGRNKGQMLKDREQVAELYAQGVPQHEIAKRVGINRNQVQYDLRCIEEEWRKSAVDDMAAQKQWQLVKINNIEAEMWAAWELSKSKRATKKRFSVTDAGETKVTSGEQRDETHSGDPRYMAIIMQCVQERSRLLGLNEVTRVKADLSTEQKPAAPALTDAAIIAILREGYQEPTNEDTGPQPEPAGGEADPDARDGSDVARNGA